MSSQITISPVRGGKRSRRASGTPATKRRKTPASRNTNVSRSLVSVGRVFPEKVRTVLRYAENNTNTVCAANNWNQVFYKANGLFDPADALGGHQPYGFDQYAAIYNHYHVYKSVATITFCNYATVTPGFTFGINITPGASDSDAPQTKIEKQDGPKCYTWANTTDPIRVLTKTWTAKRYFGTTSDNDKLSAAVTADPAELSHYCIWGANNDGAAAHSFGIIVHIDYYVEFTEPKSLGGS